MGGRGASSGSSVYGNAYGTQYHTLLTYGNIKFVQKNNPGSETLMETMTPGRVYAVVGKTNEIQSIVYFDNEGKRSKQIDLQHIHTNRATGEKMQPHVHYGYWHNENGSKAGASHLTDKEKQMVDTTLEQWQNYIS